MINRVRIINSGGLGTEHSLPVCLHNTAFTGSWLCFLAHTKGRIHPLTQFQRQSGVHVAVKGVGPSFWSCPRLL